MNHEYKNQDCLVYLKTLEDNSVDLILTDPPYFIGYDAGKGWDSQWKSEDEYISWCTEWSKELARVLKDNKMMCVFGTLKYDTFLRYKLEVLNKLKDFSPQNEIVWSYNWGGRSKSNFARKHEYIWCYSKGKSFTFNGDDVRTERKQKINIRTGEEYDKGTIPTCIWEKNNHTTSKEYCNWHPTQKPIGLYDFTLLNFAKPNDLILDTHLGSGSSRIAAYKGGFNFVGFEIDQEYYEKQEKRFNDFKSQLRLF